MTAEAEKELCPWAPELGRKQFEAVPRGLPWANNEHIPVAGTAAPDVLRCPSTAVLFTGTNSLTCLSLLHCKTEMYFNFITAEATYDCFTAIPRPQTQEQSGGKCLLQSRLETHKH